MKAYPHTKHFSDYHDNDHMNGMDLRDYFAGQALAGVLAHPDTKPDSWIASKAAYQIADNMMKARNSK